MVWVIDPGHGVNTKGKEAPDGSFFEYEFNRDIAERLGKLLKEERIPYAFTLNTLRDVSLKDRVDFANKIPNSIFLSIHANAFGSDFNKANGAEVFYFEGNEVSKGYAQIFQDNLVDLGFTNRGIKKTSIFYVLKYTKSPAILVESGFYTNKKDLKKLQDSEFRQAIAVSYFKSIKEINSLNQVAV